MHQPLQALAPLLTRPFLPLTIGAWLLTLTACTTIEVDVPPGRVHAPDHFTQVKPGTPTDNAPTDLARWWQGIPDPTLQALIEKGLTANADVRIAAARVREARAVVTQAESALYPTLAALGYAGRTQQNEAGVQTPSQVQAPTSLPGLSMPLPNLPPINLPPINLPSINAPKLPISTYSGHGFAATWEVDIFGSRRSDAEAARSAALANVERLHGAQLMVAGDIAANYVEARSLERRIGVLQRTISQAERLQRYAQGRFDAGQATRYDRGASSPADGPLPAPGSPARAKDHRGDLGSDRAQPRPRRDERVLAGSRAAQASRPGAGPQARVR